MKYRELAHRSKVHHTEQIRDFERAHVSSYNHTEKGEAVKEILQKALRQTAVDCDRDLALTASR